jgi:hypothetical protein
MNAQVSVVEPAEVTVADARGRRITLKRPGLHALEVAGIESEDNAVYLAWVRPLIYVSAIDSDPIPSPESKLEIEALISRLDEDGIEAVVKGVRESFENEAALQRIASSPECQFLLRNGLDFNLVCWLDATNRAALCTFYRKHGKVRWNSMEFEEQ